MKHQHRPGLVLRQTFRHLFLTFLVVVWLIPILWLVLSSFGIDKGPNLSSFFPKGYTIAHYQALLSPGNDGVNQFPAWFMNTLMIATATCVISTLMVLMVAYAMSCMRFKARKGLMNMAIIMNLFPGFLSMITVYFILKSLNLLNNMWSLVIVYTSGAGLGYLIAKGFFDTVSKSLREAAYIEGANEATVFWKIILPLSKPIVIYTAITAFLGPWMDFIFASFILANADVSQRTVAMGMFQMLYRDNRNNYFAQFCAAGVLVSIPISALFVLMQRFYVEGITGGSVKG